MKFEDRDQIEFIQELKLKWSDLSDLPKDQKAILSVLSFATNEMNTLLKLYLSTLRTHYGDDFIDSMAFSQSSAVLRIISSKLFEVKVALELGGKRKTTNDALVLKLAADALKKFDQIKPESGYAIARDVRHEISNHYSFSAAKKNLSYVAEHADTSLYVHKMTGNSFFPLGDEVMFMGRFNRHGKSSATADGSFELHQNWFDWVKSGVSWLNMVNSIFYREILLPKINGKLAKKRMFYLTRAMVSNEIVKVPLFLRVPKADESQ